MDHSRLPIIIQSGYCPWYGHFRASNMSNDGTRKRSRPTEAGETALPTNKKQPGEGGIGADHEESAGCSSYLEYTPPSPTYELSNPFYDSGYPGEPLPPLDESVVIPEDKLKEARKLLTDLVTFHGILGCYGQWTREQMLHIVGLLPSLSKEVMEFLVRMADGRPLSIKDMEKAIADIFANHPPYCSPLDTERTILGFKNAGLRHTCVFPVTKSSASPYEMQYAALKQLLEAAGLDYEVLLRPWFIDPSLATPSFDF